MRVEDFWDRLQLVAYANPDFEGLSPKADERAPKAKIASSFRKLNLDAYRGATFTPLPGTDREARFLQSKSNDWGLEPTLRTGTSASEKRLARVDSPKILHMATHGFFFTKDDDNSHKIPFSSPQLMGSTIPVTKAYQNPMQQSGLALAGANNTLEAWKRGEYPDPSNDGILTATEASVLDLQGTWLVNLSACETGLGEARSGEGVLGLRRAFIQAGAENLMMTLWPVSDKFTVPFMEAFYEEAMKTGDAPGSLAKVQRDLLVEARTMYNTRIAVQLYGAFVMNFINRVNQEN